MHRLYHCELSFIFYGACTIFTATSYYFRPLTNTPNGSVVLLPLIVTFNNPVHEVKPALQTFYLSSGNESNYTNTLCPQALSLEEIHSVSEMFV